MYGRRDSPGYSLKVRHSNTAEESRELMAKKPKSTQSNNKCVLQDSDYKWFVTHLPELLEKYGDVLLAIKNHVMSETDGTCEQS